MHELRHELGHCSVQALALDWVRIGGYLMRCAISRIYMAHSFIEETIARLDLFDIDRSVDWGFL
jgi:hypothetical protein